MPQEPAESQRYRLPSLTDRRALARLGLIGASVLIIVIGFGYAGGWLSAERLSRAAVIDRFEAVNGGAHSGFRRNHAKGVCVTGSFESNGNGVRLSKAAVFRPGRVAVDGRMSLAGGHPRAADGPNDVRAMALRFRPPDGEEWRTAMIDIPVFAVRTPEGFYEQLLATKPDPATGKPDPAKVAAFSAAHPEFVAAMNVIKSHPFSSGFANASYNSLTAFRFVNAAGAATSVRWSMVATEPFVPEPTAQSKDPDKNYLFDELIARLARGPLQWRLVVTVALPGDAPNDAMPYLAVPTTFSREWISQAIGNATGQKRHVLTAPSGDTAVATGHIATLGTVTFA